MISRANEVPFWTGAYDRNKRLVIDPVLSYATFLGGANFDQGNGIAVDSAGNAYIIGETASTNFPVVGPVQATNAGGNKDVFVTKINPSGTAILYSTYLGGSGEDIGHGIAVDRAGNAYITGETDSTNFPTQNAAHPTKSPNRKRAFVAKLNPAGNALVYSTYFGNASVYGEAIAVDSSGNAYLTGYTTSGVLPVTSGVVQAVSGGGSDAYVAKLNQFGSAWVYVTYLGGT